MQSNEHEKWRKFLQPLVAGLGFLVAAATLYLQRSDVSFIRGKLENMRGSK